MNQLTKFLTVTGLAALALGGPITAASAATRRAPITASLTPSTASVDVSVNPQTVQLTVLLTTPKHNNRSVVSWTATPSAHASATPTSGSVSLKHGQSAATFALTIPNSSDFGRVQVTLTKATGGVKLDTAHSSATITITKDNSVNQSPRFASMTHYCVNLLNAGWSAVDGATSYTVKYEHVLADGSVDQTVTHSVAAPALVDPTWIDDGGNASHWRLTIAPVPSNGLPPAVTTHFDIHDC